MHYRPLLIVLALFWLTGCESLNPATWFEEEDNTEPPAELTELKNPISVHTLWSTRVGGGMSNQRLGLMPAVHDGRVYVAESGGLVEALDATNGRRIWSTLTDMPLSGGPGVGEGLVAVGTPDAEVIVLNADDGSEKWRRRVSSEVLSSPQIGLDVVVVHTVDGKLTGLDAATGEKRWFYNREIPVLTLRGSGSPVIEGSTVICGFASGKLAALDLRSGSVLWESTISIPRGRSDLERMVDIDGRVSVVQGVIYVATFQGVLAAVSVDTGMVLWRRDLSSYTGLDADWRQVYVTDAEDHVWALDPRNGAALWKQKKLRARRLSAPLRVGDYVVVGDFEGYLHWLSAEDGQIVGRNRVGGSSISAPPAVEGDMLYVYGDGGDLAALKVIAPSVY